MSSNTCKQSYLVPRIFLSTVWLPHCQLWAVKVGSLSLAQCLVVLWYEEGSEISNPPPSLCLFPSNSAPPPLSASHYLENINWIILNPLVNNYDIYANLNVMTTLLKFKTELCLEGTFVKTSFMFDTIV